jgi:hypothetical protein
MPGLLLEDEAQHFSGGQVVVNNQDIHDEQSFLCWGLPTMRPKVRGFMPICQSDTRKACRRGPIVTYP